MNEMSKTVPAPQGDERKVPPLPPLFRIGKRLRHRISAIIARSSKVGNDPVLDPALFPWIRELDAHWPEIRAEVDRLLTRQEGIPPLADISPDHRRIAPAKPIPFAVRPVEPRQAVVRETGEWR